MANPNSTERQGQQTGTTKEPNANQAGHAGTTSGKGHRAGTYADGTANREEDPNSINNRDSKFVE